MEMVKGVIEEEGALDEKDTLELKTRKL